MEYIKITTPENIEVEYRLAGVAARLAAAVIDTLIQFAFVLIVVLSVIGIIGTSVFQQDFLESITSTHVFWTVGIAIIVLFLIYYGYYVICEMAMNGQTIGKKIYGLRAIRANGQPVTFTQSLSRNLFRYLVDIMFVGMFTIIFSKKNRRVGDMVAGTIVIDEGDKFSESDLNLDYVFQERAIAQYDLTSEEYSVIKEYFSRREFFLDKGEKIRRQLEQLFFFKYNVSAEDVTDDFLKDVIKGGSWS